MTEQSTEQRRRGGLLITLIVIAVVIAVAIIFGVMQMNPSNTSNTPGSDEPGTSETATPETPSGGSDSASAADGDGQESEGRADGMRPSKQQVLSKPMSGQEAIDALGDDIAVVAERNGKSVEELKDLLLRNPSAKVTQDGDILIP